LREAITLLRPKPDFEEFISLLLKEYGYAIERNQIIAGKCVEHEIDAVARKNNETLLVEIKHHIQSHTYTGLHIFLEVQATLEDLLEGYRWKKNKINFTKALVVCNTKISDHARDYAVCKGIDYIGWRFPEEKGLEQMVEEKRFYPVTLLKDLDADTQAKLGDNGIVLLKQLLEMDSNEISKRMKVDRQKIEKLIRKTRELLIA
jgi:Holliday junction resolvase